MKRIAWTFAALCLVACSDIIEKDLTGLGVILLTPGDGDSTAANVVLFKWEAVPHATEYRLQIATPGFDRPVAYLADTVVTNSSVALPLQPGTYMWRVRAQNGNSSTDYYAGALTVLPASSLDGLTPLLIAPAANTATAAESVTFQWQPLSGAADYRFELRTGDQTGPLVQAQIIQGTQIEVASLTEGTYTWGVQAQNTSSSSLFNYRSLSIDHTAPSSPLLIAPAMNAIIQHTSFTFQWQSGIDAHATVDSLFVTDANTVEVRALPMSGDSYTDSLANGSYTWWVRTTDAAGNASDATTRSLIVQ